MIEKESGLESDNFYAVACINYVKDTRLKRKCFLKLPLEVPNFALFLELTAHQQLEML